VSKLTTAGLAVLVGVGMMMLVGVRAAETKGTVKGPHYFGDPKNCQKPGAISLVTVMSRIPEYKKIKDEGLTSDDPSYWILLTKAHQKLVDACKAVHKKFGYDLIGEIGFIEGEEVPDITGEVVLEIKNRD